MWNTLDECYRADIVAAVAYVGDGVPWCDAFLAGVREDPVVTVVLRHLTRREEEEEAPDQTAGGG